MSVGQGAQKAAPSRNTLGYIPEVQGLRTVALILVAVFHIWLGRVSGGVDVFLVISTYLMTRSLTSRAEAGAITRPISHLIGKFARLLPAATTAIILILLAVVVIYPAPLWESALESARASLFYFENNHLQDQSVNYLDPSSEGPSPFQHFWSLSVQGQAFILWAALHCIGDLLARFLKLPPRAVLLVIFAAVAGLSFGYALQLTATDQPRAYFDTGARLWEFAAGSLIALIQPWLRILEWFRPWFSWIGLLGVLTCGLLLPVEASFPGWAALWPVISTALVILASGPPTRTGADRLLAHPALESAGRYTYALYLVHWPVLVLFLAVSGLDAANWWQGALVLAVSVTISYLVARLVEQPLLAWLRRSKRAAGARASSDATAIRRWWRENWRPGLTAVLLLAIGTGVITGASWSRDGQILDAREHHASLDIPNLGANAEDRTLEPPQELIDFVRQDTSVPGELCDPDAPLATELCYDMPHTTGTEPERKVLALGNSHSIQFNGALLEAVERQPTWSLHTRGAWACTIEQAAERGEYCEALWPTVLEWIEQEQPDVVVLFGTQSTLTRELSQWALLDWIAEARERSPDTEIVAVRDNPRFDRDLVECAAEFGTDAPECREGVAADLDPAFVDALVAEGVIWVDLHSQICPGGFCAPSQGGLWVFQDDNHLTDTYTRSLAQHFADILHPQLDWWPADVYGSGELVDRSPPGDILTTTGEEE